MGKYYLMITRNKYDNDFAAVWKTIGNTPIAITYGIKLVWEHMPSLHEKYKLENEEQALAFCVFCSENLTLEMKNFPVFCTDNELEYIHSFENDDEYPITHYLRSMATVYGWEHLDLSQQQERLTLWEYVISHTTALDRHPLCLKAAMHKVPVKGKDDIKLPLLLYVYAQQHLPVYDGYDCEADFITWSKNNEKNIPYLVKVNKILDEMEQQKSENTSLSIDCSKMFSASTSPGINVMGYGFGELGVGEDARCAVSSCLDGQIPVSLFNIPLTIGARSQNTIHKKLLDDSLPYKINFFCLPVPEIVRAYLTLPKAFQKERIHVFAPPWELPHMPKIWHKALNKADELWAPSRFIQKALQGFSSKPVYLMPLSVGLPVAEKSYTRADFGIPENMFLFLSIFDWNSWYIRKNPEAVIKSFLQEFPNDQNVGIVIKTIHAGENIKKLHEMMSHTDNKRIFILSETFNAEKMSGLYHCVNAYISLHRAEGFGRTLAEAMLANLPVITTNFSGNTDFCTEDTAFLVNGPLVNVKQGEYLFYEDQYWCEPSIEEAMSQMRLCYNNKELVDQKIAAARKLLKKQHSFQVAGKRYRERLNSLGLL